MISMTCSWQPFETGDLRPYPSRHDNHLERAIASPSRRTWLWQNVPRKAGSPKPLPPTQTHRQSCAKRSRLETVMKSSSPETASSAARLATVCSAWHDVIAAAQTGSTPHGDVWPKRRPRGVGVDLANSPSFEDNSRWISLRPRATISRDGPGDRVKHHVRSRS